MLNSRAISNVGGQRHIQNDVFADNPSDDLGRETSENANIVYHGKPYFASGKFPARSYRLES